MGGKDRDYIKVLPIHIGWLQKNYKISNYEDISEEEICPIVFSSYHALYPIAESTACVIYKGWKQGTRTFVAIKRLNPKKLSFEAKQRFIREYSIMRKLSHPHILKLLEVGEQENEYYFIMPFLPDSLHKRMKKLPANRTLKTIAPLLAMFISIAKALEYSHEQGILHRDIKPENIFLEEDHAYLADFGIARKIKQTLQLTQGAIGTALYMAPEAWQKEFSPQCDIYSMGVILYEMIQGALPFIGEYPEDILANQMMSAAKPPVKEGMRFPMQLNSFILKALEYSPKKRHNSMTEFIKELVEILDTCI